MTKADTSRTVGSRARVVCGQAVRGAVLELIADKLANAEDRRALMLASLRHHAEVLRADERATLTPLLDD